MVAFISPTLLRKVMSDFPLAPLAMWTVLIRINRKFVELRVKQTAPLLQHLQNLYPTEHAFLKSYILTRWHLSEWKNRPTPVVTQSMLTK